MKVGTVSADLEAKTRVAIVGAKGKKRSMEALVDTGFNGYLTLPKRIINSLKLLWRSREVVVLADGSKVDCDLFEGKVRWAGQTRRVVIHSASASPLLGMEILQGRQLSIEVVKGGSVTTKALK